MMYDDYDHTQLRQTTRPEFNRVLYLDVDGVLNSDRYFRENPEVIEEELQGAEDPGDIDRPWLLLDPRAVDRLNRIVDSVDPTVVLTSSWRKYYTLEEVDSYFKKRDYLGSIDAFIKPGDQIQPEKNELIMWSEQETSPDQFLVLDTLELRGIENQHLVDASEGLSDEDVKAVLDHFGAT